MKKTRQFMAVALLIPVLTGCGSNQTSGTPAGSPPSVKYSLSVNEQRILCGGATKPDVPCQAPAPTADYEVTLSTAAGVPVATLTPTANGLAVFSVPAGSYRLTSDCPSASYVVCPTPITLTIGGDRSVNLTYQLNAP